VLTFSIVGQPKQRRHRREAAMLLPMSAKAVLTLLLAVRAQLLHVLLSTSNNHLPALTKLISSSSVGRLCFCLLLDGLLRVAQVHEVLGQLAVGLPPRSCLPRPHRSFRRDSTIGHPNPKRIVFRSQKR
jgi:hypothetical protein